MKKLAVTISIILFLSFCALSSLFFDLLHYACQPFNVAKPVKKIVILSQGQKLPAISNKLHKAGIIQYPSKFRLLARLKRFDTRIKAGEYILSSAMPPNRILEILVTGIVRLHKITIPEGCNLYQIALITKKAGLVNIDDFLSFATDTSLAHKMGIEAKTFEGYLFPETYYFPKGVTSKKIISTMVQRFRSIFTPEWKNRAEQLRLSVHEVVTLASIIEKETGAAFERPIISSVFHNRLKRRMRLESDPTVIYGLKEFSGNITRKDLKTPTPYNTYIIKKLPPGPIANPGIESIKAALFPADTRFLYFVSKQNNTHKFSTNFKDHARAVQKYQLLR